MKKTKRVALYSPYLDILGGGEKHILSILKVLSEENFAIDILWNDKKIIKKIDNDLNIRFSKTKVIPNFLSQSPIFKKLTLTKKYSHLFYVTDGSYFFSLAEKNYIFCMYPQKDLYERSFLNNLKWSNFDFIVNSKFTKSYIDKWTSRDSTVLYPYIDDIFLKKIDVNKKDKIILSAGRFFGHLHSKRQDLLIKTFIKLQKRYKSFKDFKLVFVGRLKKEDKAYFEKIRDLAASNKNIIFFTNVSFTKLIDYYRRALFLWHAAGFEEDRRAKPAKVEHLGLVPLEAMAGGVIPFCHNSGGPRELIKNETNGFLYQNIDDLIKKTVRVYSQEKIRQSVSKNGIKFIEKNFSYDVFRQSVKKYLNL